jgi:hypothetical protein
MSTSGIPIPNILDRAKQYAAIQFINNPDILGYRIRVANNLDNAYGAANGVPGTGTTALFEVLRGRTLITKEIRIKGTAISGDITRGQTRATFDPNEFFGLSPEVPPDSHLWFMRTQVSTVATAAVAGSVQAGYPGGVFPGTGDNTDQSKITIMRDPDFQSVPRPALSLYGTAPALAGAVPGLPAPAEALIFAVPAFADAIVITNHDAVLPLFFAVSEDQPLMQIDPGTSITHASGMKDDLVICAAAGGNPNFSMLISTVTGLR